jgi:hypothetical protein
MSKETKITRRHWLTTAAVFTATAGSSLLASSSSAQGKISKAAARYRDYPKMMQMCGMCKYFISANGQRGGMMGGGMMGGGMMGRGMGPGMMAAGTCEVVEGRINPMGWCILYAPTGT